MQEDGEKIGVLNKEQAIEEAKKNKKDLVLISVESSPSGAPRPIARIMDYGKFKYDRKKRNKQIKEKQTNVQSREIRLNFGIALNDLKTKAKKAREFLEKGDRVKVGLRFRGREITRKEIGLQTLENFFNEVADIAKKTKEPFFVNPKVLELLLEKDKKKNGKKQERKEKNAKNEN